MSAEDDGRRKWRVNADDGLLHHSRRSSPHRALCGAEVYRRAFAADLDARTECEACVSLARPKISGSPSFVRGQVYRVEFRVEKRQHERRRRQGQKMSLVGEFVRESADGEGWVFFPLGGQSPLSGHTRTVPKAGLIAWRDL